MASVADADSCVSTVADKGNRKLVMRFLMSIFKHREKFGLETAKSLFGYIVSRWKTKIIIREDGLNHHIPTGRLSHPKSKSPRLKSTTIFLVW